MRVPPLRKGDHGAGERLNRLIKSLGKIPGRIPQKKVLDNLRKLC